MQKAARAGLGKAQERLSSRAVTEPVLGSPCGRRGRYNVERLIAKHGPDVRLPDLLATLADCPRARSVSIHGGVPGRFFGLPRSPF
jgi:hypothetical protein